MAPLPLTASFEGDVTSLVVPVDDQDSTGVVAEKIAHFVIGRRLPARDAPIRLRLDGQALDPEQPIGATGIGPLGYVEAFYAG